VKLADSAFHVAALTGDQAFYDKLMAALKNPKSPEEYYLTLYTLARFEDPKLLHGLLITLFRRKSFQDALGLIRRVMHNPAGEKLAWDFVRQHWTAVENQEAICQRRSCRRDRFVLRCEHADQVVDFYAAHKIEGRNGLPAVHRAHQQLRRSEVATRTATCVVAGTTRIVGGRTVGRKPLNRADA